MATINKSEGDCNAVTDDQKQNDLMSQRETGGLGEFRKADDGITRVVAKVEEQIKEKMKLMTQGKVPKRLEIVGYRINVIRGYIYFAKIKIPGGSFAQAKILETPTGEVSLQSVTETKTAADEMDYFKLPK